MDYAQATQRLKQSAALGWKPGLESIRRLCARLGDPQDIVPTVHVAGTNGKGSVCVMTAAILKAAGYRTGLYTSPYLEDWRDSISVDGVMIAPEAFANVMTEVYAQADAMAGEHLYPTEFEILTAGAFLWFAQSGCDIAAIETGMGGKLDATNVIARPRVSVITAISYDHMAYLGDTLEQIAKEKCGIIKPGGVTVCYPAQPDEALRVIRNAAQSAENQMIVPDIAQLNDVQSNIVGTSFAYRGIGVRLRMGGVHQALNAATAIETAFALRAQGFDISDEAIRRGLSDAYQPARQEVLRDKPLVLLDGAHNLQGIEVLAETVRGIHNRPLAIVMGMLSDKPYREAAAMIAPLCDRFFAVTPDNPRALPARELADIAARNGIPAKTFDCVEAAVKAAAEFAGSVGAIVICGSFYMASEARRAVDRQIPIVNENFVCYSNRRCTE